MFDQIIPLSALQHYLYCPRQCALIHIERSWAENFFTATGQELHTKTNEAPDETIGDLRILRSLSVYSTHLGISGICDVVEHHSDGHFFPIEYKRGKPKPHRADEVQLCAQALCIEEIFQTTIPEAAIFYGRPRRRTLVPLDDTLRSLTCEIIEKTRALFIAGETPPAEYSKAKCDACSLIEICQPKCRKSVRSWINSQINTTI